MTANVPVLPLAAGTLARAVLSAAAFAARCLKGFARARRHRHQAKALAAVEQSILADIGLNRSDVSDAFSMPFWEDPTLLLRERALERRLNRGPRLPGKKVEPGFRQPRTDRPARRAI
jgi:uncharacterized protein YjiS (DUF1127 family)